MLKKLFLFFWFFCFLYKPEFIFIPHSINMFMGFIGLILSTRTNVKNIINSRTDARINDIIKLILPFMIISVFSMIINMSSDMKFIRYGMSVFLAYYGAYWLAYMFYKCYGTLNLKILVRYLLFATLFHQLIALIMFFDSSIYNILQSFVRSDASAMEAMDRTLGIRLQGLGASFFTAGLIYGYVLIILALALKQGVFNTKEQSFILTSYMFITLVGIMMARTTIVGFAIGLVILFSYYVTSFSKFIKTFISFVLIISVLYIAVIYIYPSILSDFEGLFAFAFEIINNYNDSGEIQSGTTDSLLEMWGTIPSTLKTWLIGDARWTAADGRHYYMKVDVGYLRNLWYFGLIGTFIYLLYNFNSLKLVLDRRCVFNKNVGCYAWIALFLYTLIINTKGPIDLLLYIFPFLFIDKYANSLKF